MIDQEATNKAKRVARRCIDLCHCYGKLCDNCQEAKELLNDLGANDDPHYHKAHYVNGKLTDECDQCGRDLRNPIHVRLAFQSDLAKNPRLRIDQSTLMPIEYGCCGHASDCAVHNAPALPVGPCDCGARL